MATIIFQFVDDCRENILLNYVAGMIHANTSVNSNSISDNLNKLGIIHLEGIKTQTLINSIWYDKIYGLKNLEGLMIWLKIVPNLKNEHKYILEKLSSYFQIDTSIIESLVRVSGNTIADNIESALGSNS